ncbi:MAG TPA: cobalamin-binding protein [Candidatus Cloacimonadota bacterium]|nr:cobalamin-binding protein [Candidatus Cloacimonadota bacterium]
MNIKLYLVLLISLALLFSCKTTGQKDSGRYVVLSPEVAELLCALGLEDRIVGVTKECSYPPALASKEIVGDFGALDREKIIQLQPGIIFSSALEQEAIAAEFTKLGLRVESFYPTSLEQLYEGITRLGEITGTQSRANALSDSLKQSLQAVMQEAEGKRRPRIYLEIYRDPLMSVSDQSFVGALIELAGGDNVFDRLERDYARVDPEKVIEAAPDIMICYSQDSLQSILSRKGWQDIPALKNGRVYFEADINPDWIQRAGPRIVDGAKRLRELCNQWEQKL